MNDDFISPPNISATDAKSLTPKATTFPRDVFKWMKANAQPQMSLKLMQVCKYFQHQKFPYFVVRTIKINDSRLRYFTLNKIWKKWKSFDEIPNNLWITKKLSILLHSIPNLSNFVRKIVVCNISKLYLREIWISINDFKTLTSTGTVEIFEFNSGFIKDENDEDVPLEKILECLPNITELALVDNIPEFTSVEIAKTINLPKLVEFNLDFTSNKFSLDAFFAFMEKNKFVNYMLIFYMILDLPQAQQLEDYIDKIVAAADTSYPPPYIEFPRQCEKSKKSLEELRKEYF